MTAKLANDECLFAPHWNECKDYIHVTKVHFINLVNPDIINNNPNIYIYFEMKKFICMIVEHVLIKEKIELILKKEKNASFLFRCPDWAMMQFNAFADIN